MLWTHEFFNSIAAWGSFVSGVGVLVSLIFLNLQVGQTERNQRALVQQARANRISETNLRLAEPDLSQAYCKGIRGEEDISLAELRQFRHIIRALGISFEDSFIQHKNKLLDETSFASFQMALRVMFASPGFRAMWKETRNMYEASFIQFIDAILQEPLVAPAADDVAQWKALVMAEKRSAIQ